MDEQKEAKPAPVASDGKAEWTRPEVDRLLAGAAEGSADISFDGVDIPS